MEKRILALGEYEIEVYGLGAVVAGSGAAGLNAACTLWDEGVKDIAVVADDVKGGTSRNAGSDKQTYYKLSLSGADRDSVRDLAQTLFQGGCMDGDIALCEAAASAPCFIKLAQLGVPFPKNRYGEYVGYKTDHDPFRRATSAGPYTSKFMTEALERSARSRGIRFFNRMQIVKVLVHGRKAVGMICLSLEPSRDIRRRFTVFVSPNTVWAAGGPGDIYHDRVYPDRQHGAAGAAFEAGAAGRNLTEWQYGLASVRPRWNVSGTYMQVLPRFVSVDGGGEEREFLSEYFGSAAEMLSMVFLKGYQWPFDTRKIEGSSLIDILVYNETRRGRRVFLDYRTNPLNQNPDYGSLSPEARDYLRAAGACFGNPVDRLEKMNRPALDFYRDRGVDLRRERLEIALCAQHHNGGLAVDCWWRSNLEGFFPVGEAAGTHGIYRPGGSALNAGQAGSLRAALFIARKRPHEASDLERLEQTFPPLRENLGALIALAEGALNNGKDNVRSLTEEAQRRMSLAGGPFRNGEDVQKALKETKALLKDFSAAAGIAKVRDLPRLFRLRDILLCQRLCLSAMEDYIAEDGRSRGSALYADAAGKKPHPRLPDLFRSLGGGDGGSRIQEITWKNGRARAVYRERRPIPMEDDFFENVWKDYREHGNVY
jgi:succinate dehydrogenase/fumarate reductase flavoprotein subunit